MDRRNFRFYGIIQFLLVGFWLKAGDVSVTVARADNNRPLSDAIVKVQPLQSERHGRSIAGMTDAYGQYTFSFSEPAVIRISFLGFKSIIDTLYRPEDRQYALVPVSTGLNDIVVTGQYAPESYRKSVYEIKVVSAETIRAKGANNLREALQNELNIDLGQDQVFGSSLGINGISGEGIKIMVDGVPVVGRVDGKLDLSQININNIERIEIVEGPMSVLYGTDAMGGVINIITKAFQKEKVNVGLRAYYETAGQYNVEMNGGFVFRNNQIFITAGRNFFDGYSSADSIQRFQEWKPKEQYFADAKYMYTSGKYRVSLTGAFFREMMLNRSAPRKTLDYQGGDTAWTYTGDDQHYLTYRPRAALSFMYRFRENMQLDALLSYSGFIRFVNKYTKNLVTQQEQLVNDPGEQDTAKYHQILFRGTYSMPAWKNRINFMFGTEISHEFTSQTRIEGGAQQAGDYAAYGSVKISIVDGLDIQPAARIIYNTRFAAPIVPSINIKYNWKQRLTLRASYGKGYRAPSLKELYLEFFDSNHSLQGNTDLKPENGHVVNGSGIFTLLTGKHNLSLEASGFFNLIRNKIDWRIKPSPGPEIDTFQYFNIKEYRTAGGDIGLTYIFDRIKVNASTMLTHYQMGNVSGSAAQVKMFSADVTAGLSYSIPKAEIGINVFYKYNGPKPLFSVNSSIQAGTRAAYHMLDVSLNRNFWKNRIQLSIGGKNLLGVTNVASNGVSSVGHNFGGNAVNIGWGRTFFTSVIFQFAK